MPDQERLLLAVRRDFRHAVRLDLPTLFDLFHAVIELAIARLRLSTRRAQELLTSTRAQHVFEPPEFAGEDPNSLIDRVSFAVPRMGSRVPWRADCLVQALAAQNWLGGHGVMTAVVIGVRTGAPSNLEAHAWLMAGDRVVTGGEVDAYQVILKQPIDPNAEDSARHQQ